MSRCSDADEGYEGETNSDIHDKIEKDRNSDPRRRLKDIVTNQGTKNRKTRTNETEPDRKLPQIDVK